MTKLGIEDRMIEAVAKLAVKWPKRRPTAFYLNAEDWAAFMATNPSKGTFAFGNNPVRHIEEPAFRGLPVRTRKTTRKSILYNSTSSGNHI